MPEFHLENKLTEFFQLDMTAFWPTNFGALIIWQEIKEQIILTNFFDINNFYRKSRGQSGVELFSNCFTPRIEYNTNVCNEHFSACKTKKESAVVDYEYS